MGGAPPIGMSLFVTIGVAKDLMTRDVIRGVVPFIICDIVRVALLVAFPISVTWLPSTMQRHMALEPIRRGQMVEMPDMMP
jgi:TRAP-type C4-dicarboxylate transport system permease large subunit